MITDFTGPIRYINRTKVRPLVNLQSDYIPLQELIISLYLHKEPEILFKDTHLDDFTSPIYHTMMYDFCDRCEIDSVGKFYMCKTPYGRPDLRVFLDEHCAQEIINEIQEMRMVSYNDFAKQFFKFLLFSSANILLDAYKVIGCYVFLLFI